MAKNNISPIETNRQLSRSIDINELRAWLYDLRFEQNILFSRVIKLSCGPIEIILPINQEIFKVLDAALAEVEGLTFETELQ